MLRALKEGVCHFIDSVFAALNSFYSKKEGNVFPLLLNVHALPRVCLPTAIEEMHLFMRSHERKLGTCRMCLKTSIREWDICSSF